MNLRLLPGLYAVCRLPADVTIPAAANGFWSVTRTNAELSLVCEFEVTPEGAKVEGPWRGIEVEGPLDFGLKGVLLALVEPLYRADISVFVISTFDTDYLFVKAGMYETAVRALADAGHRI